MFYPFALTATACPRCKSTEVERRPRKPLERLLLVLYPYECRSCRLRWYNGAAGQRRTGGADPLRGGEVQGHSRCGLGKSPALQDGDPGAAEEVPEFHAQRRASADRVGDVAAQRRAQPG